MRARDVCHHPLGEGGVGGATLPIETDHATDEQTKQAIEDWHYWVKMDYEF